MDLAFVKEDEIEVFPVGLELPQREKVGPERLLGTWPSLGLFLAVQSITVAVWDF
jgi:hypothetical protein